VRCRILRERVETAGARFSAGFDEGWASLKKIENIGACETIKFFQPGGFL